MLTNLPTIRVIDVPKTAPIHIANGIPIKLLKKYKEIIEQACPATPPSETAATLPETSRNALKYALMENKNTVKRNSLHNTIATPDSSGSLMRNTEKIICSVKI